MWWELTSTGKGLYQINSNMSKDSLTYGYLPRGEESENLPSFTLQYEAVAEDYHLLKLIHHDFDKDTKVVSFKTLKSKDLADFLKENGVENFYEILKKTFELVSDELVSENRADLLAGRARLVGLVDLINSVNEHQKAVDASHEEPQARSAGRPHMGLRATK